MRISTAQMFTQNTNNILNKQSAVNAATQKISSGKRVETSGDDPVAALGIDNLNQKNALADQYIKNIDYANNRLAVTESKLGSAENLVMSMRDQLLRANSGALSAADRQTIADELKVSLEELQSIANSQDENGNYLFAGYKTDTQPFSFDNSGKMIYSGDSGVRTSGIASGVTVNTNVPGDHAFMNAPNAIGDFSANYLAGQSGEFQLKSASITNPGAHTVVAPENYTFNFTDNGAGGVQLEVQDSAGTVLTTVANFESATPVTFNGIETKIVGTPAAGDSFTMAPETQTSIFDSFNQAIALLEDPDKMTTPQGQSELAQLLDKTKSETNHLGSVRGETGISLKSIERYKSNHQEEKLVNNSALSLLEDLDYASAITEFEKQQLALNAVSQTFSRVNSTSLFDYLR